MFLNLKRRTLGLAAAALLFAGPGACAEPATIKLMVGFPPGGGTDAIARVLADKLKDQLGMPTSSSRTRPVPAARSAAQALKAAPADGSVLFLSHDHTISILPLVVKNPGFDPAQDFVPVAGFATFVNGLALSGGTPAKTVNEYVAWVREQRQGQGHGGRAGTGLHAGVLGQGDRREIRPRPAGRALPRQRAHDGRHAGQPDRRRRRLGARLHREPQGRQDPHGGRDRRQAPGHPARCADLRRTGPEGLRRPALLRHLRARTARPRRRWTATPMRWPRSSPCPRCTSA